MSLRLAPYPAYRDSGAPWIGGVPEHWSTTRLKNVVRNVVEQTDGKEPGDRYVALEDVESWTGRVRPAANNADFVSTVKRFVADDVLFGKLRPYLAKVARPLQSGVCVGEFLVLRPSAKEITPPYLEQALRSAPFIHLVSSSTFGAKMPRAEWSFIGVSEMLTPPVEEQREITAFLDHADRRINRLIRAKRRLIELLNEQKQAIIHRAVTRGLAPNVRLKPSGIDWLGDVPEHWDVLSCNRLFREVLDQGYPDKPLLSIDRFRGVILQSESGRKERASEDRSMYKRVQPGQLAYNVMNAFMGSIGVSAFDGILSPAYAVAQPLALLEPQFVHELFRTRAAAREFERHSYGIMYERNRLYFDRFRQIRVAVPPIAEQRNILDYIADEMRKLNHLVARPTREIDLLREYRTRLIADVVTGKLDVRGVELPPLGDDGALDEIDTDDDTDADALDGTEESVDAD